MKLINNNIRIAELDSEENTFKHYKQQNHKLLWLNR